MLALSLMLLLAVARLPQQIAALSNGWPVIRRWTNPDAQYRLLGDAPYEVLRAADGILPRDSALLLVTSGQDVRHLEYTTYHRSLYFLAPRPVWWLSPAPSDGTWESRWWISAPVTASSIQAIAAEKGLSCLLLFGVNIPGLPGWAVHDFGEATLWQLGDDEAACVGPAGTPAPYSFPTPYWPLRLVAALLVILAVGYGAVAIAGRLDYRVRGVEAAALAWVLGTGILTTGMWWLNAVIFPLKPQITILSVLALLPGVFYLWERRRQRTCNSLAATKSFATTLRARFRPGLHWLLAALLAFQAAHIMLMAGGRPLTVWDSWVNWGMKSRIIFRTGGVAPAVYADPSRAVALLDYPLSIPLAQAWLYGWLGAPDDRLAGAIFLLSYLALVGVLYGTLRRWDAPPHFALLATAAIASIGHVAGLAAIAFPDVIVTVLATVAGVSLIEWLEQETPGALLVAALAAGLLPWTKREGLLLLAALTLALLLVAGRRQRRAWLAVGACGLAAAIFAGPWWAFASVRAVEAGVFLPLTPTTFWHNLGRLPAVAGLVAQSLAHPHTGFVWPLAALVALWSLPAARRLPRVTCLLPLTAFLYVGLMSLTYLFSDFVPFQQHVVSSAYRLIAHVTPLLALWIARLVVEPVQGNK